MEALHELADEDGLAWTEADILEYEAIVDEAVWTPEEIAEDAIVQGDLLLMKIDTENMMFDFLAAVGKLDLFRFSPEQEAEIAAELEELTTV